MPAPEGYLDGLILRTQLMDIPVGRIITDPSLITLINASDFAPLFDTVYVEESYGTYPASTNIDYNPDGSATLYFDDVAVGTFPSNQAPSEE